MALNHPVRLAVAAFALVLCASAAANFAASPGFSGRQGVTCIACHTLTPAPFAPPEATAILEGLPAAWDVGATYRLTVRVEGGPAAMPAPQPQGGFDLAANAGTFAIPDSMTANLRIVAASGEVTYTEAGTLMRQWEVDWTAPGLAKRPAEATLWLAVIAANGNHVVATNTSDGGERFDAAAHLVATVPASAAAEAAWKALPLAAPEAKAERGDGGWNIAGRHLDGNASRLAFRLDDGAWLRRDTAANWRLAFPGLAGAHTLTVQSEGADRASPPLTLLLPATGEASVGREGERPAPTPLLVPLAALAAALAFWRNRP